jgi:hypothetical protein
MKLSKAAPFGKYPHKGEPKRPAIGSSVYANAKTLRLRVY